MNLNDMQRRAKGKTLMMDDLISRQAAVDEIDEWIKAFRENGHKESAADACLIQDGIIQLPSAQADGWLEQNKDKILQAGMEGREIDFHIGGRLFAIREKAQ